MNREEFTGYYTEDEDIILQKLSRETHLTSLMPRMLSGHVQGKILEHISKMIQPEQILEIGTFTGYSALCLAKGLQKGGLLHTFEINDERETIIRKYIELSGNTERIILHIGDALEYIDNFEQKFDLAFIDADKKMYPQYYEKVFDKLKIGGYVLIDNVFWDDKVLSPETHTDQSTKAILRVLDMIKSDKRAEQVIIPLRDGLMLVRKNAD